MLVESKNNGNIVEVSELSGVSALHVMPKEDYSNLISYIKELEDKCSNLEDKLLAENKKLKGMQERCTLATDRYVAQKKESSELQRKLEVLSSDREYIRVLNEFNRKMEDNFRNVNVRSASSFKVGFSCGYFSGRYNISNSLLSEDYVKDAIYTLSNSRNMAKYKVSYGNVES